MRFRRLNVYGVRVLPAPREDDYPMLSLLPPGLIARWHAIPRPGEPRSQWQIFYDLDDHIFSKTATGFTRFRRR
jgi:hypothetical protein